MSAIGSLWDDFGQSVWLDFIQRGLLVEGGLERLVATHGVRGVTSNPTIFCKAIAGSAEYDSAIARACSERPGLSVTDLYEELVIEDIRLAADVLRPVFDGSGGGDGFVSLEVSPHLAADVEGTVAEARRLWHAVDRPNLMIKVPATRQGIPAIETLIADGVNVNATLIFSLAHYEAVAVAYLRGLERCPRPADVASVASFFVSRIDTAVDARLEAIGTPEALAFRGTAAIACARSAWRRANEIFHGSPFAAMARRDAHIQRPLWASTSTKNPAYRDVVYIEELIGEDTVNTIPMATLEAFADHGRARASLAEDLPGAARTLESLERLGVDLERITEELQEAGVEAFIQSFDELLATLERRRGQEVTA